MDAVDAGNVFHLLLHWNHDRCVPSSLHLSRCFPSSHCRYCLFGFVNIVNFCCILWFCHFLLLLSSHILPLLYLLPCHIYHRCFHLFHLINHFHLINRFHLVNHFHVTLIFDFHMIFPSQVIKFSDVDNLSSRIMTRLIQPTTLLTQPTLQRLDLGSITIH